jgi:hypothetical protein
LVKEPVRKARLKPKKEKAVFEPATPETFIKEMGGSIKEAVPLRIEENVGTERKQIGHYFVNGLLIVAR